MRLAVTILPGLAALALAGAARPACAQDRETRAPGSDASWADPAHADLTADLNRQPRAHRFEAAEPASPWVAATRDVWAESDDHIDRFSVRVSGPLRALGGAPLPDARPGAGPEADTVDFSFARLWPSAVGRTASGLEVSLTPHAEIGMGDGGASLEAGATLRIGRGLERLAPDGSEVFGDRPRWYVYAAGSGRAVGYNFARNRDGAYARSGYSQDDGVFLGDAQLGVAVRRGSMQSSIGLVYRELDPGAVRNARGMDTDVSEGLFAFQFSIRP